MEAKDVRRFAAEQLVDDALNALVTDVDIAQDLGLSLASTYPLHRMFMSERVTATTARVAFEIKLPVLQSLPVETILNVRRDEHDSFQRFRDALRTAISDRVRLQPDANVEKLAEEIQRDVLEPRLRDIEVRLRTAQRALLKKAGVAVGVGAMLTTCGLLAGLVPVALGAATIAGGVIVPSQQYVDKKADIELSDMFFLWRLTHEH